MGSENQQSDFTFRVPDKSDGYEVYQLIDRCRPLDLNSSYAYFIISDFFRNTSVIVNRGDDNATVGFISGFIPPEKPDTIFIWQVAVDPSARGHGLAGRMLRHIVDRSHPQKLKFMETTIGPGNEASQALFNSFARKAGAEVNVSTYLSETDFGSDAHETEELYRIGPFEQSDVKA